MKRITLLLALAVAGGIAAHAAEPSTNSAENHGMLLIDSSSMPVAAGKVTLIIGPLQRTNDVYAGYYKIKVLPYFWKNEKGRLAITVSDESLAEIDQGKVTAVTGTAITSGEHGKSRHIDATVTPADRNHGMLKVSFVANDQKMVFAPPYRVVEKETPETRTRTDKTKL